VLTGASCISAQGVAADSKLDAAKFADPPAEYRPVDCWWWDYGKLTEDRLRWQLDEMHAKGVGGTWLYPRFGANQPQSSEPGFFTEGWWGFVRFVLDEQQRLGMVQYANDWLGRLDKAYFQSQLRREAKDNPKLMGRRLVAHTARSTAAETLTVEVPAGETVLSAVAYHLREASESEVDDETRIELGEFVDGNELKWEAPGPEWLAVVVCSQPHDLNYLDRAVADRWIEIFYEPYRKQLGDRLGKSLVAYGPDERAVLGGSILYSDEVRGRYEKRTGADLLPDLAALFVDIGPRTDAVRCQYYDAMNGLLEENLYAPMADWLHDHGMKHVTIATWGRENMLQQTSNYGDYPRMMKHFDMPGNEDSKESGPGGAFIDTKMSSSMAHLNGQSRVAVCAYWGMGWGYLQEDNIARTNLNYALGINLYNTHGVMYSLLAGRNEWVPPEVHFYQPYWETWRTFTDYVSRLSYVLSQGRHRADVALVYPLSTIHANWHSGSKFAAPASESQSATFTAAKALYAGSLDFDFVDEARLADSTAAHGTATIAAMDFPVIVLPAMTTIRRDAMERIRRFVEAGGTLVVLRRPPTASTEVGRDDPELLEAWHALLGEYEADSEDVVTQDNASGGHTILLRTPDADLAKMIRGVIRPDISTTAADLAHTHQQVGSQHVYYFVNRQREARSVDVLVRAKGRPEIWDARTGEVRPLYRFEPEANGTKLHLDFAPGGSELVVLNPEPPGPQVTATNLQSIELAKAAEGVVEVVGTLETGENANAEVVVDGRTYTGRTAAPKPIEPLKLDGDWECEYRPTMNNRWGDYRYPAEEVMIGPEAPRLKYRAEPAGASPRPAWETKLLDDDDWQQVTSTFGPYWQALDPMPLSADAAEVREKIGAGDIEGAKPLELGGKEFKWQPYSYSWTLGADRSDVHQSGMALWDGLGPVSPNFLAFDGMRGGPPLVRYLATRVYSPEEQSLYFDFGGVDKAPQRQAWVNGELVVDIKDRPLAKLSRVALRKGWNQVVLRLVQTPSSKPLATFAVFHAESETPDQPRFMPLSRWYDAAPELTYDALPEGTESIAWYRFTSPPGAKRAKLNLIAQSVEAWVDGEKAEVAEDTINFPTATEGGTKAKQVALRVRNKLGYYEGAAFRGPIAFECGRGEISLGDWCESGLAYYSGGLKYQRTVNIAKSNDTRTWLLDLGDIRTSAELKVNGRSIGVLLAPPFVFDVTNAIREGDNEIEVEVLNTLANFMSAGPTKYVYKGQTVSGLLGPVTLRAVPRVRIECRPTNDERQTASGGAR